MAIRFQLGINNVVPLPVSVWLDAKFKRIFSLACVELLIFCNKLIKEKNERKNEKQQGIVVRVLNDDAFDSIWKSPNTKSNL